MPQNLEFLPQIYGCQKMDIDSQIWGWNAILKCDGPCNRDFENPKLYFRYFSATKNPSQDDFK